jgi:hypothetical protein
VNQWASADVFESLKKIQRVSMDYYPVEGFRAASMECVLQSAIRRNVPANVLLAIGQHEAGKEGSAIRNKNGTFDLGRTGINTVHLEEFAKYGVPAATAVHYLRYDGCFNYDMAAFLLKRHLLRCKAEFWTCVANYHANYAINPEANIRYQGLIRPLANAWGKYLSQNYPVKDYSK